MARAYIHNMTVQDHAEPISFSTVGGKTRHVAGKSQLRVTLELSITEEEQEEWLRIFNAAKGNRLVELSLPEAKLYNPMPIASEPVSVEGPGARSW